MSRRSSRRNITAAFPALPAGTQSGLQRLVSDNVETVAKMLDADGNDVDKLCEKCAQVMKQQQLSASSFLARFFDTSLLAAQAKLYQKSTKGSAATLADRIATAWANNIKPVEDEEGKEEEKEAEDNNTEGGGKPSKRKRDKEATVKDKEVDDDEAEEKEEPKKKSIKKGKTKR